MNEQEFTAALRRLTQQRPFIPFIVEMTDGRRLVIDHPAVAFGGGAAGFLSESDGLVDFCCEDVHSIAPLTSKVKVLLDDQWQPTQRGTSEKRLQGAAGNSNMKGMTEELFTTSLRELTTRKPFWPFVVELLDGRRIVVDYPSVAFSGGAAGFLTEHDGLIRFSCEEVKNIALAEAESTA
jgi:hypothetical protein